MSKTNEQARFRKLFLVEPSHDFTVAKKYSERIALITDGGEKTEDLPGKIYKSLEDFDFDTDAVIPMGKVASCLLVGIYLMHRCPYGSTITVGIYRGDKYEFIEIIGDKLV